MPNEAFQGSLTVYGLSARRELPVPLTYVDQFYRQAAKQTKPRPTERSMLGAGEYTVGWICALPTEYLAAQEFLDEEHGQPEWRSPNDTNAYVLGAIGKHNIVIAVLPMGEYGTASAASVATNMLRSFPNVRIGLMVGIAGGAPSLPERDIRLGDIVVGSPENGQSGVLQYDFGKSIQEKKFQYTLSLSQPPQALLTALAGLRTRHEREGNKLSEAVDEALNKRPRLRRNYGRPSPDTDVLFQSDFVHVDGSCVSSCDQNSAKKIHRPKRDPAVDDDPAVHYGTVASGNTLMKDALIRDKLAAEKNVLCFEMEAAGLMNRFPCLVIRGICDYSDSHKSKEWQGFAAMVAAAYAKELIRHLVPDMVQSEKKLSSILSNIQETTIQTRTIVQGIESHQNAQEKQVVLDWVTSISFGAQQSDLLAKRHPGTCQWLLHSDEYHDWVENSNQTLFCPGIPGAGKTILSSIVIHDLQTKFTNITEVGLAYIYCNFKNHHNQDIRMLLASILKQLCQQQPTIPDVVKFLYDKHKKEQSNALIEELFNAFVVVATMFSKVYLVIDALDEWQEMESDRSLMLRELLDLRSRTGLNLFATSRPIEDIKREFNGCPSVEISAAQTDMALYISGHQNMLPRFVGETPGLLQSIQDTLCEASQGMFLIAQLYLEWLKTEISVRDLENTLAQLLERSEKSDLGQILGKAYDETMERIFSQNARHKELARKVLSWVSFTKGKLKAVEIQHALAVKDGDTRLNIKGMNDPGLMVSVCCGLVTVDEASGIIRLVHHTTQEYFRDNESHWFPDVQAYLTKQCVSYLSLKDFEGCVLNRGDEGGKNQNIFEGLGRYHNRTSQYPFYEYAARNWGNHARNISGRFPDDTRDLVLCFLDGGPGFEAAVEVRGLSMSFGLRNPFGVNGLHLAAHFGLHGLMDTLLEKYDLDSKDDVGQTALTWACAAGHKAVAELLIQKSLACEGADLNVQDRIDGYTPLCRAAYNGHHEIVELLVRHGAETEIKESTGLTPIVEMIYLGRDRAFEILLKAKGGQAEQIFYAQEKGLLPMAIGDGKEEITQMLLDTGIGIDTRDNHERTGLIWAVSNGQLATARLALDKGADPNSQDDMGTSSLMRANEVGAQLLLERGANPDLQDKKGQTPLMIAIKQGNKAKVNLLLEHNADPNLQDIQDSNSRSPLMEACCYSSLHGGDAPIEIVRMLLDKGAKINIQDSKGRSPLMEVCCYSSLWGGDAPIEVVRMLLEKGAEVNVQDSEGRSPLMEACRYLNSRMVELILERDADLDLRDKYGNSALMDGWINRSLQRLLIKKGAFVDVQNYRGQTRLMTCVREFDQATSELIIERSKDLNLQDEDGMNALDYTFTEWPSRRGGDRESIRRLLIEKGVKANVYHQAMDLSISCPPPEYYVSDSD